MEATAEITAAVKNVPALRFPEFEGEWEVEPIGDYITLISGFAFKGKDLSVDPNGTPILRGINITEGYIRHSPEIDRYYLGAIKPFERYLLKKGDMVLGMDGSKVGKNVALITEQDKNSLLIQRVARIRSNSKSDIKYIYQRVHSKQFHNYVDVVNTSSGIPHISAQQIKDFKVGFPSLPEQQKIASFLTIVDDKIQQLNKKKELLEKYKKGVVQQIFSQQIRFKDDSGNKFPEWEEKMIKDIAPLQRGFDLPVVDIKEGEYPVVFSNGILKSHSEYKAKGPGVVTGRSGTIGQVTYVEKDYWPHNTSLWVTNFWGNDPKYVFYFYQQFKIERFGTGSGVPTLNRNDVHVQKVYFPSYPEQVKIRDFLTSIDGKLTHTSKQLEQAQQFKKGLLQQLFV